MPQSRQLAAIIFTDIVGYTALMGADEEKAFAILNKNRALQKPIIDQFNGRWIKELGDGVMASFHTISDAVYAAIKIQDLCNTAKDFQLRIGIHLGEVVFENKDVFGDGVNIASRIQAIAEPGSIYISESVYGNISNKKDIKTKFIKEVFLKNVKEPVKVYEIITSNSESFIAEKQHEHIPSVGKRKSLRKKIAAGFLIILIAAFIIGNFLNNSTKENPEILPKTDTSFINENLSHLKDSSRRNLADNPVTFELRDHTPKTEKKTTTDAPVEPENNITPETFNNNIQVINGSTYWEKKSSDYLKFTESPHGNLNFDGKIGGYITSGTLKVYDKMQCRIVKGGTATGTLSFIDNNEKVTGTLTISENGFSKTIILEKKTY